MKNYGFSDFVRGVARLPAREYEAYMGAARQGARTIGKLWNYGSRTFGRKRKVHQMRYKTNVPRRPAAKRPRVQVRKGRASLVKGGRPMAGPGSFRGYFRRRKLKGPSVYAKRGVMTYREDAGVITQDKCVYIGHHTMPTEGLLQIVAEAILRRLAKKAGLDFSSTGEVMGKQFGTAGGSMGELFYGYRGADGDSAARRAIPVAVGMTWKFLAQTLVVDWKAVATTGERYNFHYIELCFNTDNAVPAFNHPSARVYLNHVLVSLKFTSELAVQNRTIANTGGTGDEHHSMLNVENNPIQGYCYYTSSNQFGLRDMYEVGSTRPTLTANSTTGVIQGDPDDAAYAVIYNDVLSRPPMAHVFNNVKGRSKVSLAPGAIKKDYLKTYKVIPFNTLIDKVVAYLRDQTLHRIWLGKSKLFAFEKMMHTNDATEPDMSIGYEVNHHAFCYIKETSVLCKMEKDV